MPVCFALEPDVRRRLERMASGQVIAYRNVQCARVLLSLAENPSPSAVARKLRVDVKTVRKWRDRSLAESFPGLRHRPRTGRRPR